MHIKRKPMHRKNLLSVLLLTTGLMLLVACSDSTTPDEYVARAIEQQSKGDVNSAIIELKNALQKAPRHAEARYLLGTYYYEQGALISAEKEFYRAIDYGVERESVAVPLARVLLAQGKFQELIDSTDGLALTSASTRANLLALKGHAYLGLIRPKAAEQRYKEALQIDKTNAETITGQAQLALVRNQFGIARKHLDTVIKSTPDFAFAQNLLGLIELGANNLEAAEQAYSIAQRNVLYRNNSQQQLVLIFIQKKQFDKAVEMIDLLKQRINGSPKIDYLEGFLAFRQRHFEDAKGPFETLLGKNSDHVRGLFYGGATNAYLGNFDTAKDQLERHLRFNPGNIYAQTLVAQVELAEGNPEQAQDLILSVLERYPDDLMALNLIASASLSQGSTQAALTYLEEAAQAQPKSIETQIRLGNLLVNQGQVEAGLQQLEKAYQLEPDNGRVVETLVRQYLKAGKTSETLALAKKHLALNPNQALPHALLGMVYIGLKDNDSAEKELQQALSIDPGATSVYNGLAALAIRDKKYVVAEQYLRKALNYRPGDYQTVMNLVTLKKIQGRQEDVADILTDANEVNPRLEFQLLLGRTFLGDGAAQKAVDLLINTSGSDNTQKANVLGLRAEALLAAGHFNEARQVLKELLVLAPKTAVVHFYLAQAAKGLGEPTAMRVELETAAQLDANYLPAKMALARIAVEDRNLDKAESLVAELEGKVKPENPGFVLLKAQLAELNNDLPAAILGYQASFDSNPNTASLLRLTRAQWRNGDKNKALSSLQSWHKAHPQGQLVQHDLAQRYLAFQRSDDAVRTYQSLLEVNANDTLALNNLASLLTDSKPKEALAYAKRANALVPEDPAVMDTLAGAMLSNKDIIGAKRMIEKALGKKPDNKVFLSRQAQIHAMEEQY